MPGDAHVRLREYLVRLFALDVPELDSGVHRILRSNREAIALLLATLQTQRESSNEVFRHLLEFFSRYYDADGSLSLRPDAPAGGRSFATEDVTMRWRNADQYHVSAGTRPCNYAFLLPDNRRVRLVLSPASASNKPDRRRRASSLRFRLALSEPVVTVSGELVIRLEHRFERDTPSCSTLNHHAQLAKRIVAHPSATEWAQALACPDQSGGAPLATHLARFAATQTSRDQFVHRDLRTFLSRELSSFAHEQILGVDLEHASPASLAQAKAVRCVGSRVIDMLTVIEEAKKKLWLKKKFVLDADYCITLDRLPASVLPIIFANAAQVAEWRAANPDLGPIDLDSKFQERFPHLVVDTAHFIRDQRDAILSSFDDLDAATQGVLIHADNFHALKLLQTTYNESVRCIYIDPPFNTGDTVFAYHDDYQHSAWLTMMRDRTEVATGLLASDGTFYVHIDGNEKERLKLMLEQSLVYITEIIWRIGWLSGYKTRAHRYIRNHDTIYQFAKTPKPFFVKTYIPYPEGYTRRNGSPSPAAGYPLEDTWNCSELDRLNSIQIVSFSREKVGSEQLTQKNEALVARMVNSSSAPGDLVLDYFVGSGTTAATAHKLGRRWIAVESGSHFHRYTLPRLKAVLSGDPYGISRDTNWGGGGMFKYLRLESYDDALENIAHPALQQRPNQGGELRYTLSSDGLASLNPEAFKTPFACTLRTTDAVSSLPGRVRVDLVETFNYLLGLRVTSIRSAYDARLVEGTSRDGRHVIVIWRSIEASSSELESLINDMVSSPNLPFEIVYANLDADIETLRHTFPATDVCELHAEFERLMFDVQQV
ncbi:MAG TPA: site-specific DNA-methyltransferase [Clostridia bacterium]|nr:site-specific DNA-methyltransferase [Clostridia bacterium]